ncbi:MAG: pilus assembly protein [Nocardioides sp.]|nr:pilus assembly protein [Nocardioides sp.]
MRSTRSGTDRRLDEGGSAVVDFVLVLVILVPLLLGILQVAIVLHVRNTLTAAASEGARHGATEDRDPPDGAAYTRRLISEAVDDRYANNVTAHHTSVDGANTVEVVVRAEVPALGFWGPAVSLEVEGHAIDEDQ